MIRYIRAFFRALILTLRGQKPPTLEAEEQHADLLAWCRETLVRVNTVNATIEGANLPPVTMHIEGRDVTLKHALDVLHYHASREYPHLIRSRDPHAILAIQATNMNDQFLVLRLSEYEGLPSAVKTALDSLVQHLTEVPTT